MDLSLIGPDRRERTRVGASRRARFWLTLADMAGLAAGAALAVVVILGLIV